MQLGRKKTAALDWLRSKARRGEIGEVGEEEEADWGGERRRRKRKRKRRSGKWKEKRERKVEVESRRWTSE
jgi:hypothetical protein